jgi:DNA-binding NarL/FixJ family response regulator
VSRALDRSTEATPGLLTKRQLEVIRFTAQGFRTTEMATKLFISERTVKLDLYAAMTALGARNRPHAVAVAYELGLITPGSDRPMPISLALARLTEAFGFQIVQTTDGA